VSSLPTSVVSVLFLWPVPSQYPSRGIKRAGYVFKIVRDDARLHRAMQSVTSPVIRLSAVFSRLRNSLYSYFLRSKGKATTNWDICRYKYIRLAFRGKYYTIYSLHKCLLCGFVSTATHQRKFGAILWHPMCTWYCRLFPNFGVSLKRTTWTHLT